MTPEEEHKYTQYVLALEKENAKLKDKIIECINCHNEYIHPALCPYCENAKLKEQLKRAITIAELLNVDEVCADTYWDMIAELEQMKKESKQ